MMMMMMMMMMMVMIVDGNDGWKMDMMIVMMELVMTGNGIKVMFSSGSNPCGYTQPLARRRQIYEIARLAPI